MKLKENGRIPYSEIFVIENGEPIKKNIEDLEKLSSEQIIVLRTEKFSNMGN